MTATQQARLVEENHRMKADLSRLCSENEGMREQLQKWGQAHEKDMALWKKQDRQLMLEQIPPLPEEVRP